MEQIQYTIYANFAELQKQIAERHVLLLDNETQSQVLDMDSSLAVLENAIRDEGHRNATNRPKIAMHMPTSYEDSWFNYVSMEGAVRSLNIAACRIRAHIWYHHRQDGQVRHDYYSGIPGMYGGLVLLFSSEDGTLLAILNDGHIQHMRVAAISGLSAKYSARQDSTILGILGTGGLAVTHAWAMTKVRPIQRIKVYSPTESHRMSFAKSMSESLGVEVVPLSDPREVVTGSDIVSACTNSNQPVIQAEWVTPGTHITVVTEAETGDDLLSLVDRYLVYRGGTSLHFFTTPEEWRPPYAGLSAGGSLESVQREHELLGEHKIADFRQVLNGEVSGRASEQEITYMRSEGTGVQFAALGYVAYQKAVENDLGRKLPLAWFLQTVRS